MNRYDAIIQANRDRLRPILMTTIALVAGMVPLVISHGTGLGHQSLHRRAGGGRAIALPAADLLAVPVFYSLFEDLGDSFSTGRVARFFGWFGRRFKKAAAVSAALVGSLTSLFGQTFTVDVKPLRQVEVKPRVGIVTQVALRLPEVIERVLANDPDLAISRIQLQEAGYLIRSAQGYYDPLLGMRAYRTHTVVPVASLLGGTASGKLGTTDLNFTPQLSGINPFGGTYALNFEQFAPNHGQHVQYAQSAVSFRRFL